MLNKSAIFNFNIDIIGLKSALAYFDIKLESFCAHTPNTGKYY